MDGHTNARDVKAARLNFGRESTLLSCVPWLHLSAYRPQAFIAPFSQEGVAVVVRCHRRLKFISCHDTIGAYDAI